MELAFFNYPTFYEDSVIIRVSGNEVKLKIKLLGNTGLMVIYSDSLSKPLPINRDGDKIEVLFNTFIDLSKSQDAIAFGSYQYASVSKPDSGYSISRYCTKINYK